MFANRKTQKMNYKIMNSDILIFSITSALQL